MAAYTLLLLVTQNDFFFYFRCGIVSLWMAGQFLDPSNDKDVIDLKVDICLVDNDPKTNFIARKNMCSISSNIKKGNTHIFLLLSREHKVV